MFTNLSLQLFSLQLALLSAAGNSQHRRKAETSLLDTMSKTVKRKTHLEHGESWIRTLPPVSEKSRARNSLLSVLTVNPAQPVPEFNPTVLLRKITGTSQKAAVTIAFSAQLSEASCRFPTSQVTRYFKGKKPREMSWQTEDSLP